MSALQSAVVNHEAETYSLFRRVCPDGHAFRPIKDYTARRIQFLANHELYKTEKLSRYDPIRPKVASASTDHIVRSQRSA